MLRNWRSIALLGALLLMPALSQAAIDLVDVTSISFDINFLWKVYNTAKQNNDKITEWPTDLNGDAGIVLAQLKNKSGNAVPQPYFRVSIKETSYGCTGSEILTTPLVIQLKDTLAPGEMRTANMTSWTLTSNSANGQFCSAFENDIKSKLDGVDPSQLQEVIKLFNSLHFEICLQQCDSAGSVYAGAQQSCTSLNLFTANNAVNQTIVAMLLYPHNNEVPNTFPNFVWSPAILSGDIGNAPVYYTLEVTEQGQDAPYWSVDIAQPNAQFYQWKGSDRALQPGKSYCWKVISQILIGNVKKPVGANGKGWNITKCFTVKGDAPERCQYTKEDLDKWLQANASADVKAQLKGQAIKDILEVENDPVICRLLAGQVKFTSIKVDKQ